MKVAAYTTQSRRFREVSLWVKMTVYANEEKNIGCNSAELRYSSQSLGRGHPPVILGTLAALRQSRSYNHFSTLSPAAYRIGSLRVTSLSRRPAELEELGPSVDPAPGAELFFLSSSISLRDSDRPVPSYLGQTYKEV